MTRKLAEGAFFTEGDPFTLTAFQEFADVCGLRPYGTSVIEPFAGSNNLIDMLENHFMFDSLSFDINPQAKGVWQWDSIKQFPPHWANHPRIVITNPPWLAKNSAKRQGLPFPDTTHNDLYKLCLDRCLDAVPYVAALVPASFIHSNYDCRRRLLSYTLIHSPMFFDTAHPTALVCFGESTYEQPSIFYDDERINSLDSLRSFMPAQRVDREVKFNEPHGSIGLKAFDGVNEWDTIKFCRGMNILSDRVNSSSRCYTRMDMKMSDSEKQDKDAFIITRANSALREYRELSRSALLTPFKSLNSAGVYRRRITYKEVANFLNSLDFA